jgi:hypothetical protein
MLNSLKELMKLRVVYDQNKHNCENQIKTLYEHYYLGLHERLNNS